MLLVALSLGALGMRIPQALRGETFEKNVMAVRSKLALAAEVMCSSQTDVLVHLRQHAEGISVELEAPLPPKVLAKLNQRAQLRGIQQIFWEGKPAGELTLHFSRGTTPRGALTLRGSGERRLWLPGYPTQYKDEQEDEEETAQLPTL